MKAHGRNMPVYMGPSCVVPKEVYQIIRSNEFTLGQKHCGKRDISTISTTLRPGEFFDLSQCQMYITASKGTNTPASHKVVAEKHCVVIAKYA